MLRNNNDREKNPLSFIFDAEHKASALCFICVSLLAASGFLPFERFGGGTVFLVILAISAVAFLVPSVVFGVLSRKNTPLLFKAPEKGTLKLFLPGVFLLTGGVLLSKSIIYYITDSFSAPAGELLASNGYFGALFCYTLLPAVLEEILFRGIAFPLFEKRCGGLCAVVLTSLFFGMAHLSAGDFIPYFLAGVVLGFCVYITRSVFVTMALHLINNLLSFYLENSLFKISAESKSGIVAIFLLAAILLVCLFWFLTSLEGICRKRYLSSPTKNTDPDCEPSLESQDKPCFSPRLFPIDSTPKKAFARAFLSPFLWGAVVVFVLYVTVL